MVGLVRSTRYVLALASPAPPAPLPRSGFVLRPHFGGSSAFDLSPKAVVHEEPVVVGNAPQSQPFWYEI